MKEMKANIINGQAMINLKTEFVGVEGSSPKTAFISEANVEIKIEPDPVQTEGDILNASDMIFNVHKENIKCEIEETDESGNVRTEEDDCDIRKENDKTEEKYCYLTKGNDRSEEENSNLSEKHNKSDFHGNKSIKSDHQNDSDVEMVSRDISNKLEDCEIEYLDKSLLETLPQPHHYKEQIEEDSDYEPPTLLMQNTAKIVKHTRHTGSERISNNASSIFKVTIDLNKYRRTTRIGRCIFHNCSQICVSYVPRTVRRRMIMECNMYIPRLSKVCEEHLQDQNWEELLPHTTASFTANHCQDMKNIVAEACKTNFDLENIETVDCKLVRYWFDVNKSDFNRIFSYFPKLKRLKKAKTAFALYLMHLQNTSIKRIALLFRMSESVVKSRIIIVSGVVQCESYEQFKEKFLEDD